LQRRKASISAKTLSCIPLADRSQRFTESRPVPLKTASGAVAMGVDEASLLEGAARLAPVFSFEPESG
jgi:hypothetical protein